MLGTETTIPESTRIFNLETTKTARGVVVPMKASATELLSNSPGDPETGQCDPKQGSANCGPRESQPRSVSAIDTEPSSSEDEGSPGDDQEPPRSSPPSSPLFPPPRLLAAAHVSWPWNGHRQLRPRPALGRTTCAPATAL